MNNKPKANLRESTNPSFLSLPCRFSTFCIARVDFHATEKAPIAEDQLDVHTSVVRECMRVNIYNLRVSERVCFIIIVFYIYISVRVCAWLSRIVHDESRERERVLTNHGVDTGCSAAHLLSEWMLRMMTSWKFRPIRNDRSLREPIFKV